MFATNSRVMIVSENMPVAEHIREVITNIGLNNVTIRPNYAQALKRVMEQRFDLVIFDILRSDITGKEFVKNMRSFEESCSFVGLSETPEINLILDLLEAGTQGFLISPYTEKTVREVIETAQHAPAYTTAMFDSVNRITTFKSIVLYNLNKLAEAKRVLPQQGKYTSRELITLERRFFNSVKLAKQIVQGQESHFLTEIIEGCLRSAEGTDARIAQLKDRLSQH
ncbi:MAG: response regulator [Deltaproteobacteria bacterium]|nr:response regulator [Deltaproteobacteria bacterium]